MLPYLIATLEKRRLTIYEAFQVAYYWRFNKQGEVTPDYCAFVHHGILPKYVIAWVKDLQAKEK